MAGLDTINEDGNVVDGEDDTADAGGLAVYSDPNVQTAVATRNKLNDEYRKYYDDLTAKIMAKRTGPSFSERMYQLSAAFAAPTATRGFSGVMGNVMPVLQKQQEAQREGEVKRQDALSALQAAQLAQRAGLANQDVTTAIAMANLAKKNAGSGQTYDATRGVFVNRNNPRPTENVYDAGGGRTLVQWQDGLWRETLPSGMYRVFERAGDAFKEVGTEGAR